MTEAILTVGIFAVPILAVAIIEQRKLYYIVDYVIKRNNINTYTKKIKKKTCFILDFVT